VAVRRPVDRDRRPERIGRAVVYAEPVGRDGGMTGGVAGDAADRAGDQWRAAERKAGDLAVVGVRSVASVPSPVDRLRPRVA
jgi:hypothetical protein